MNKLQLDLILNQIKTYAETCQRKAEDIKLLAVTKTHSAEFIRKAIDCGIEYIAESKVQEAESKIPELNGYYKEFHFVGYLQSNKINKLLDLNPILIHSIDKFSTAQKLNNRLKEIGRTQDILIEVNTSGETAKHGVPPANCPELIRQIDSLEYIRIKGLMTLGALTEDVCEIRQCFRTLKTLFDNEKDKDFYRTEMLYLSMGMSGDFQIAIEEGANIIRLGSVLFGPRDY